MNPCRAPTITIAIQVVLMKVKVEKVRAYMHTYIHTYIHTYTQSHTHTNDIIIPIIPVKEPLK